MTSRRELLLALLASTAIPVPGPSYAADHRAAGPMSTRPNIITIVLDDVGYSDVGCFGGEIRTPNIDRLAHGGLRYNHFDTKAVCSATRAALLTGRNNHTVNMPDVPDVATPKTRTPDAFHIPRNAETLAQVLKKAGYATWAIGKWHLIPADQQSESSSQDCWPLQRGFDYFYGFTKGWTDQYRPDLVENNRYIHPEFPPDYHFSKDIADRTVSLVDTHLSENKGQPFYLNLAFGAAHAPIQVPHRYSDRYDATYAAGWDAIRHERYERMKQMGILPQDTALPPRNPGDRAWSELSDDEKVVFTRFMAVYAGFLEHADEQIGRLLDHLEARGLAQNTIIVVLSDNGAASEAGQAGEFDGLYRPNRLTPAQERARLAELGGAKTQAAYPRPWAMASSAPLRRYKLWPHAGGVRTPLIVAWPGKVRDPGAIRRQFVDVIDIAPTLLEAAGARFADSVDGVPQIPVAGRSFAATIAKPSAPAARSTQYFELRGNRAITAGAWRAIAMHRCGDAFDKDEWQLFDLARDFSESRNLAAAEPDKLQRLKDLWASEWRKYSPRPLAEPPAYFCFAAEAEERGGASWGDGGG